MDSLTQPIHIDLYDFEDPKYEDSKYVLTSPRSLEACARVGVKPVELLYKPLADFQDEFLTEGMSLQAVYNLYDAQENERIGKLKDCRQQRDRLVNEDDIKNITQLSPIPGSYLRPRSPASERSSSPGMQARSGLSFASKSATLLLDRPNYNSSILDKKSNSDNERESPRDKGSLQRMRTAWATSGGDNQFTGKAEDLDNKEKHLFEKSEKLSKSLRQRANSLDRPRKSATPSPRDTSGRSRTNSERSLTLDSTWASVLRSSIQSAKPISDAKLRSKLRGCKNASVRIPERDRRILSRIMAKEEDEKQRAKLRESAIDLWEEERKKVLLQKEKDEVLRKKALIEKTGERQKILAEKESKRRVAEESELKNREQKIQVADKHWEEQATRRERERRQKLLEKKEEEIKRRRSVERNLQAKEKEMEEFGKMVIQHQDRAIQKAMTLKETQLHEERIRLKHKNKQEMREFKQRHRTVEKMTEDELSAMRATIDYKHKKAEENIGSLNMKKYLEVEAHHREREKQERLLKQNLEKREKEMKEYQKNLVLYRKVKEDQADEIVNSVIHKKKLRALEERIQREAIQKANYKKQQKKEAAHIEDVRDSIAWKDAKAQVIQQEKDQTVAQLRALAHTSELLREELKVQYNKDSFDKKAQRVALESKIGAGYRGGVRNTSSVKLY